MVMVVGLVMISFSTAKDYWRNTTVEASRQGDRNDKLNYGTRVTEFVAVSGISVSPQSGDIQLAVEVSCIKSNLTSSKDTRCDTELLINFSFTPE